jgi:hypothetical protein
VIHCQASGNCQLSHHTAGGLACCYPYMFRQSAKSAIPPAVMQCTARATEPETTGRVCSPVIVCYSGLTAGRMQRGEYRRDHGPDATGRIRSGTAGQIVAPVKRRTVTATEADAPSGAIAGTWPCRTWHHPPRYRHRYRARSCGELASRYQAVLSRRIRDSYTIRPVTGSDIGPGRSEYPPSVRSELAPRYRRRDDGQRNRGIGTIRRVDHEIGHYPPRYRAAKLRT